MSHADHTADSAPVISLAVAAVLAGTGAYDELSPANQAVVRALWSRRMNALRRDLDFATEFAASGRTYVELTDTTVVHR